MKLKSRKFLDSGEIWVKILAHCREKIRSRFYPGDLVTEDRDIHAVCGRLHDRPGELGFE